MTADDPGSDPDLQAGAESFRLITQGLTAALGELRDIGSVGSAGAGRGFEALGLSGLEVGYGDLADAFSSFCDRWEWGVRSLVGEANDLAAGVGLAAGTYDETDQYVEGALKIGVNSVMGNPHLTEDQVTARSWDDVWADNPVNQVRHADYSDESWDRAGAAIRQGYRDTARDVVTSDVMGTRPALQAASGLSDEDYQQAVHDSLGPTPEERAAAGEQPVMAGGDG